VGTPAASNLTLAPGAGHGDEGDASFQGPAQEEALSAQPKSTNQEPIQADVPAQVDIDAVNAALSSVVELKARMTKPKAADHAAVTRETGSLVTVRAKPEKRLNAKDRAKARRTKNKPEAGEAVAVTPEASGLSTAHPKPAKRKNAKERAKEKYAKANTKDGTTPDMTVTAKSKAATKAKKGKPTAAKAV